MKPSEQISKRASELYHLRLATIARTGVTVDMATQRFESSSADASAICEYLDTESARRAQFEAEVLERIGRLEAPPEKLTPAVWSAEVQAALQDMVARGEQIFEQTIRVREVPTGVYAGDGLGKVRRYEPSEEME